MRNRDVIYTVVAQETVKTMRALTGYEANTNYMFPVNFDVIDKLTTGTTGCTPNTHGDKLLVPVNRTGEHLPNNEVDA